MDTQQAASASTASEVWETDTINTRFLNKAWLKKNMYIFKDTHDFCFSKYDLLQFSSVDVYWVAILLRSLHAVTCVALTIALWGR